MRVHLLVLALFVAILAPAHAVQAVADPDPVVGAVHHHQPRSLSIEKGPKRALRAGGKSKISDNVEDSAAQEERFQLPPTEELAKLRAKFPKASQNDEFLKKMQFFEWNRAGLKPDDVLDLVKLYETKADPYISKYLNAYIAYRNYYNKIHGIPHW